MLRKNSQLRGSFSPSGSPGPSTSIDASQRRFEEAQRNRRAERVAKLATKTHKDRVQEFNEKLDALSEHHDIPKVGPG
ncbi:uncharacterized protein EI90DRAFT_3042371 [Cantharellus anzutake]|uniref:uncharacterized protein n=1 Tax=Cantharellus anzutake TaxID=1750568 RepID=UPI0019083888|nr:uncharacterized protein EI90DRAFT_3042371 [Cantharellus anzutake]KAF8338282.1 hypothetical protein EI90DRAFT_3042371 [Cantharellus anzutake]